MLSMGVHQFADGDLVGLGRGGRESERDIAETQLEQPVAAWGLAVIIPLGRRTGQDLDRKSVVEGKSVSVRVDLGGRRISKKKKIDTRQNTTNRLINRRNN